MPPKKVDKTPAKKNAAKTTAAKATDKKDFKWSDDEVELLLNVSIDYKVAQAAESVDWESVKSKYKDILQLYVDALPADGTTFKSYPHKKDEIKLLAISSKLKAIRTKFCQAVDSGRRSGHGRVVMIYYELCQELWGGSPATMQIGEGIESYDLTQSSQGSSVPTPSTSENSSEQLSGSTDESQVEEDEEARNKDESDDQAVYKRRREFLETKLKKHREENLKRELPVDAQLLECAQQDLAMKKHLVEQADKVNEKFVANMEHMSKTMDKLTDSIADGFSMLRMMMCQQPTAMYPPPMYPSASPYTPGSSYSSRMPSFPQSTPSRTTRQSPESPSNIDQY